MSLHFTAWQLVGRDGQRAHCVIAARDGRWQLIVQEGKAVTFSERCRTDDAALARAQQIWGVLVEKGWREPSH